MISITKIFVKKEWYEIINIIIFKEFENLSIFHQNYNNEQK